MFNFILIFLNKMKIIHKEQILLSNIIDVWDFISSPINLDIITPPDMKFNIRSVPVNEKIYPGQIIEYTISPFLAIKMNWVTEITHVKENYFFVDEQRFGPYKFWHHQHKITAVPRGVLMEDIVHYELPFGFIGDIAHKLVINKQLEDIFKYRFKKLDSLFN